MERPEAWIANSEDNWLRGMIHYMLRKVKSREYEYGQFAFSRLSRLKSLRSASTTRRPNLIMMARSRCSNMLVISCHLRFFRTNLGGSHRFQHVPTDFGLISTIVGYGWHQEGDRHITDLLALARHCPPKLPQRSWEFASDTTLHWKDKFSTVENAKSAY